MSKKKNRLILSSLFLCAAFLIILGIIFLWGYEKNSSSLPENSSLSEETAATVPKTQKEITQEIIRKKIQKIQNKNALKGLVLEGDTYFQNNELTLALKSYLEVFRKNKNDTLVIEKIGDTYAAMKRFKNAQNYYKELSLNENNTDKILRNLLYSIDIKNPLEREKFLQDISQMGLSEERIFYYTNSFLCIDDFHNCKIQFGDYFSKNIATQTHTGSQISLSYTHLRGIQQAIQNYENFQLDQVYFKDALIIGQFFQDKMYPIALVLGEKLIQEKSDYKVILKIIAESYFELGNYTKAKEALTNYYKLDTSDPSILYMLGIIYSEEKDFILSNIYFTKALEGGFEPTMNARRNIVYNYFLLENPEGFLGALQDLIEKEKMTGQSDLRLAVYYHIIYEDIVTAKRYIQKGKKLFPKDAYFYGYAGFLLREEKNYDLARQELELGYQKDPNNPLILLNLGLLEKELGNTSQASLLLQKVIVQAPESEFGFQAQTALGELEGISGSLKKIFE